jgi:hypothetical protein
MHQGEQGGRRKDAGVRSLRENTVFCYLDGNSRVCITSAGHRSFLWVGEEASFTDRDLAWGLLLHLQCGAYLAITSLPKQHANDLVYCLNSVRLRCDSVLLLHHSIDHNILPSHVSFPNVYTNSSDSYC